jgi:hypothetical protein
MAELVSATLSDRISAVTLPDPARAIRDDHHDLEHFEPESTTGTSGAVHAEIFASVSTGSHNT